MKLLILILLSPLIVPFVVVRFALRLSARIFLPLELVFLMFGFGIAWCICRAWNIVYAQGETASNWKSWGWHMTEAGFDTLTALLLAWCYFYFVLHRDLAADLDNLFGNIEAAAWIPFWLIALVPFCIRLNHANVEDATHKITEQH